MIKKIKSAIVVLSCCFLVSLAYGEPSPFGIKIKETTIEDIKKKYSVKHAGINKFSKGPMFDLNPSQLGLEGIRSARVVFGQDDKVLAVLLVLNKDKYDELYDMLSTKYKCVSKKDAFVGNRYAEFEDDKTKILLNSPHLSFALELDYLHSDFHESFVKKEMEESEEKTRKETEKL